jgi:hypothetical protein
MPKKYKKRNYRTITFKVYLDDDDDILDWWDGIESGERSDAIRDMIREFLGLPAKYRRRIQIPGLSDMHRDILWIHNALNDMPDYLQNLLQEITASQPVMMQEARASPELQDKNNGELGLNNTEQERRNKRMRKATW